LVVCRTTLAIASPPAPKAQPTSLTVGVPVGTGAEPAACTDERGLVRVLAPRGWSCNAMFGADGSGGVALYPPGEHVPADWGAGWRLPAGYPVRAVTGSQTSA
jgi:hypothetical protein